MRAVDGRTCVELPDVLSAAKTRYFNKGGNHSVKQSKALQADLGINTVTTKAIYKGGSGPAKNESKAG